MFCQIPSTSPVVSNAPVLKRLVLRGGIPFKNKVTMTTLLKECVNGIDENQAKKIVDNAEIKEKVTIIICKDNEAQKYYRNLIENGIEVELE